MSKETLHTLKPGKAILFYSQNRIRIRAYSPEKLVQVFEPSNGHFGVEGTSTSDDKPIF